MLFSVTLDRHLRSTYRIDALGNVAWAVVYAVFVGFALVVARRAGAGTWLISGGISVLFAPLMVAWLMPRLCRRFSLGGVILALRLAAGVAILPSLLAPSLTTLTIGYTAVVFASGLIDVIYPAMFHVIYPPAQHVRAMSLLYTERALGSFALVMLFGWLLKGKSPEESIRILGLLALAALLSAAATWRFRGVKECPADDVGTPHVASPFANRHFRWYLAAITFFGCGMIIHSVMLPLLQVDTFTLDNSQVGIMVACTMVGQVVTYLLFSRVGVVNGSNRLLAGPYLLQASVMIASLFLLLHPLAATPTFLALLAAAILGSIGGGWQTLCFFLVVNAMAKGGSALSYQATQNTVIGVRGVVMPFIAGMLYREWGLLPIVAIAVALILAGALVSALSPPLREQQSASVENEGTLPVAE